MTRKPGEQQVRRHAGRQGRKERKQGKDRKQAKQNVDVDMDAPVASSCGLGVSCSGKENGGMRVANRRFVNACANKQRLTRMVRMEACHFGILAPINNVETSSSLHGLLTQVAPNTRFFLLLPT